ncbi:hypothetical protein ACFLZH_06005 [Patescibacteria group bacterium]
MYLYKPDKEEYREYLIDPFLPKYKKGDDLEVDGFEDYVKKLIEFVVERVEDATGASMKYDSSSSEESGAIASIELPGYFGGGMGFSLSQTLVQTLSLQQQLVQNLSIQVLGSIDIEECSDIEAAYMGAYSVLLHELGHHFDYVEIPELTEQVRGAHEHELDPNLTKELICDRIGLLLGKMVMPCLPSQTKQRLFWISRMGLLHGFFARINKALYKQDEGLVCNLLREKLEFEKASKIKIIGDETRKCIDIALGDVNDMLQDLQVELCLTDEQLQLTLELMRRAYRAVQKEMLEISE